jgi:hypothetical protein
MADYTVVARVSRALQDVLTEALADVDPAAPPVARLHNLKPPPAVNPPVLTLFLYEITEDAATRNQAHERQLVRNAQGDPRYRLIKPPMPLVLRYLVTPWAADRATEQLMIGRTLQVMYERQIRRGDELTPPLDPGVVSITLSPLSLDERARVWWSIQEPYRLSLNYELRVVDLDVSQGMGEEFVPVRQREFDGNISVESL